MAAEIWHWLCCACERARAQTVRTGRAGPGLPRGWAFRGCGVVCAGCQPGGQLELPL